MTLAFFSSPGRWRRWSPVRTVFVLVAIGSYLATEFGRLVLRPRIRDLGTGEVGLLDSIGNWGGILVQIFVGLAIPHPNRTQSYRLAIFYAAGFILYEFLQPYLPKGTFDWNDVLGTLAGWVVAMILLALVWKRFPDWT
jgi:uncharacterized membrane protein YccC